MLVSGMIISTGDKRSKGKSACQLDRDSDFVVAETDAAAASDCGCGRWPAISHFAA